MISRKLAHKIRDKGLHPKDVSVWEGKELNHPATLSHILRYESTVLNEPMQETNRVLMDLDYCGVAITGVGCVVLFDEPISQYDEMAMLEEGWRRYDMKGFYGLDHRDIAQMLRDEWMGSLEKL